MYGHGTVIFINEIAFSRDVYDTLILSIVIIILLRHDDQIFFASVHTNNKKILVKTILIKPICS
jgi:hypothetical protein